MIVRIVKMTFHPESVQDFMHLFNRTRERIRHFEGCNRLELWRSEDDSRIFFTHSHWESALDLENYRHSELFRDTWKETKKLFAERAEAWSVKTIDTVD